MLDDEGAVGIASVTIDGPDVLLTLTALPAGATHVRYALDYAGSGRGGGGTYGCGNLRDSAPETITIYGTEFQLFNAAPAFQMPVARLAE